MSFSDIGVIPHILALACFTCGHVCNYYALSPCVFSGLEREMEYSKAIVNLLQKYLESLIDIYMKVNE